MENLQEVIWRGSCRSDFLGHMHFTPHFPSSLTGQLSASTIHTRMHWNSHYGAGETLLSLQYGILTFFLVCLGEFCQKDLTHSLIRGPISLQAHINLQIQAINPTYICPSNGCVRMNSTHIPSLPWLKHEAKERKWIPNLTTHLWFTNIYSGHKARTKHTWQTLT